MVAISKAHILVDYQGALLAGPIGLSSPISHFHYNYAVLWDRYDCPHGYKACLNVGPAVSARSWLLSALLSAVGGRNLGLNPRRLWSPNWRPEHVKYTPACNMAMSFFFLSAIIQDIRSIVINRQQPQRWHHSGFVVLGRSLVKQNADREAPRPFAHYVE